MVYEDGGHVGYKPTSYTEAPEGYYIGGYEDRMAYGYGGKYLQNGGPMVPTYQNAWRNRQYSQPVNEDYYGETSHITANKTTPYRMGGMMADGGMMGPCPKGFIQVGNDCVPDPNVYNKVDNTYSDQNRQSDMFSKAMEKRFSFQAPEEKYTNALTIPQGRTNTMNPGDTIPIKKNNYTYFPDQEAFGKVPYHMTNPPVKGVIPTSQYIKDYSPYKTPYEMGGNIGYSRNQSLYGGMINTQTSPFWGGYRTKGQEGMEMQQAPQPQGDPMLAQARQAMLQGAGQPQGPVADPMMEDQMMQQMEQGMMPGQGQQPQAPQGQPNPIDMIAQALPDWFKSDDTQGGLGIFTQPAVTQLRKAGFSDREIATFNPNQAELNSPIIQFLAQEASTMEEPQGQMEPGMQPGMEQMRRGGSMKHLKKGEYVKFQMGGSVYEGRVKYYDPYTGNFELSDNY
jgi:hypothetical protein